MSSELPANFSAQQKSRTFPLTAKSKRPKIRSVSFPPELCLHDAIRNNDHAEVLDILQEHAPCNGFATVDLSALNQSGVTALHQCALQGSSADLASLLIRHGANVSARDVDGWQPLHAAAAMADVDMLEILLLAGADPMAQTPDEELPEDLIDDYELCAPSARILLQLARNRSADAAAVRGGKLRMRWPNSRQDSGVGLEETDSEADVSDSMRQISQFCLDSHSVRPASEAGFVDISSFSRDRESMSRNCSEDEAFFEERHARTQTVPERWSIAKTTASLLQVAGRIVDDDEPVAPAPTRKENPSGAAKGTDCSRLGAPTVRTDTCHERASSSNLMPRSVRERAFSWPHSQDSLHPREEVFI